MDIRSADPEDNPASDPTNEPERCRLAEDLVVESDGDPMRRHRAEIENELRAELEAARDAFLEVKDQYQRVATSVTELGPSDTDAHQALRSLVVEQGRSMRRYCAALGDWDEFLFHGVVPERLRDPKRSN